MKTRTTILAAILGLSVLVSTPVSADSSCRKLHDYWNEFKITFGIDKDGLENSFTLSKTAYYQGYIAGWVERDRSIKLPTNGEFHQYAAVVGKWLEENPEKWHEHRSNCVYWALGETYGLKD